MADNYSFITLGLKKKNWRGIIKTRDEQIADAHSEWLSPEESDCDTCTENCDYEKTGKCKYMGGD